MAACAEPNTPGCTSSVTREARLASVRQHAQSVEHPARRGRSSFAIRFDRDTELTGLHEVAALGAGEGTGAGVSSPPPDDMAIFVAVNKLDERAGPSTSMAPPATAKTWFREAFVGCRRRELDIGELTDYQPVLKGTRTSRWRRSNRSGRHRALPEQHVLRRGRVARTDHLLQRDHPLATLPEGHQRQPWYPRVSLWRRLRLSSARSGHSGTATGWQAFKVEQTARQQRSRRQGRRAPSCLPSWIPSHAC